MDAIEPMFTFRFLDHVCIIIQAGGQLEQTRLLKLEGLMYDQERVGVISLYSRD